MPGLTAKIELKLLEEKAKKLIQKIFKSRSKEEIDILKIEYKFISENINICYEILNKTLV